MLDDGHPDLAEPRKNSDPAIGAANLYPTYRKPFDLILQAVQTGGWRARLDSNLEPTGFSDGLFAHTIPPPTNGLGGSAFNPRAGSFLLSNSQTEPSPADGEVMQIDPKTLTTHEFLLTGVGCQVSSLAMGPSNINVLVGCENLDGPNVVFPSSEIIMDAATGKIITTITEVGGSG